MKQILFMMAMIFAITLNAKTFNFEGTVKQAGDTPVTLTVYAPDGTIETMELEQTKKLLGLKTITTFDLDLEEDSHYTLYFQCGEYNKMVYIDTHDICSLSGYMCYVADMDTVIYYDPVDGMPNVLYMDVDYIDWLCENFPTVRDYNDQLREMGSDIVQDCSNSQEFDQAMD